MSPQALSRIQAAVDALGYELDVVAQSLVRKRSRTIAVSLFAATDDLPLAHFGKTAQYFYLGVLENREREAVSLGYDLVCASPSRGRTAESYVRGLQTRRVAGCIMLHATEERIGALIQASLPTVFIDRMG